VTLARCAGHRPEHAWAQYCTTPVYGLGAWRQTIAAGKPIETCLVAVERFAAAYGDLR
jgi:hypothetical protein